MYLFDMKGNSETMIWHWREQWSDFCLTDGSSYDFAYQRQITYFSSSFTATSTFLWWGESSD